MADTTIASSSTIGQLLSGLFSGGIGLSQLFGSGNSSASGSAAAGAAAANPFGGQYASYQPILSQAVGNIGSMQSSVGANLSSIEQAILGIGNNGAGYNSTLQAGGNLINALEGVGGAVGGMTPFQGTTPSSVTQSGGLLNQQLNELSSNYMSNPAIQAQYKLGLDTTRAGLQASGLAGSGESEVELEKYGQQFASSAYEQQFNNLINQSQTAFSQNVGATQLGAGLQAQGFQQGLGQQGLIAQILQGAGGLVGQQAGILGQQEQAGLLPLTSAAGVASTSGNLQLSTQQNLINELLAASGATTGSPQTAGNILSGEFANANSAAGNLGAGLGGIGGALNSLFPNLGSTIGSGLSSIGGGISNLINSIFGGGGGGSDVLSGFGSAGFDALSSLDGGAAGFSPFLSDLGGGITSDTIGNVTSNVLGDIGSFI